MIDSNRGFRNTISVRGTPQWAAWLGRAIFFDIGLIGVWLFSLFLAL